MHPQQLQPILAQASGGGGCWCCLSGPHSPFTTEPSSPCLPLGPKTPLHAPEAGTPSQFTLVQRVDWKKNMLFSAGTTSCKGNLRLGSREMGADRQSSRKLETLRTPFECLDPAMPTAGPRPPRSGANHFPSLAHASPGCILVTFNRSPKSASCY